MPQMDLTTFFSKLEHAFQMSEFDSVADHFVLPSAVYIGDNVIVLNDRAKLLTVLKHQCKLNYSIGVRNVRHKVVGQSLSRKNNYWARVVWSHYDEDDLLHSTFDARYFCRDDSFGIPQIQLVEFMTTPACYSWQDVVLLSERRQAMV
ncbi:MAG: hypothetical protein AB8B62_19950 [Roseobacter sp.]